MIAKGDEKTMRGEKIYEYELDVTGVTDYGIPMDALLSGQVPVPPSGARIDVSIEGRATGRLAGRIRGIDYVRMRADGRIDLDIHATIETEAGQRIAFAAGGVAAPRPDSPVADIFENVTLSTAVEELAWVNARQIWGVGTVDFAAGKVRVEAFMQ